MILALLVIFNHILRALSSSIITEGSNNATCPPGTTIDVTISIGKALQFGIHDCVVKDASKQEFKCFKLYNTLKTWSNAESSCVAQGGHLASLNTLKELEFASNVVLRQYVQVSDCNVINLFLRVCVDWRDR